MSKKVRAAVAEELRRQERLIESDPAAAIKELRALLSADPLNAAAYRLLSNALEAPESRLEHRQNDGVIVTSGATALLLQAEQALRASNLPQAEIILRSHLLKQPGHADALALLGRFAIMIGYDREAAELLRLAIELGTGATAARYDLASALHRLNRPAEALAVLDELLRVDPRSVPVMNLKAAALARAGQFVESEAAYQQSLEISPDQPRLWMHYGHLLKSMGRQSESVAALRRALKLNPSLGEAWWSLGDLKTVKFDDADVTAMNAALNSQALDVKDRVHLHFALGKADEDARRPVTAFEHYAEANRLQRQMVDYDPDEVSSFVAHGVELLNPAFFASRTGWGDPSSEPIFIVGMPRSGSTLIEQILASHSMVEGTTELPEMLELAGELGNGDEYFEGLAGLTSGDATEIGKEYLDLTRRYRTMGKPFFTDKMPNNWMHLPLIHLALPNARVIDVRRHPLACCFSNFKQHFVGGQAFTYDLTELGRFYSDYARFMDHIDRVLPGRVHRVFHERLVNNPEAEIRDLLSYLGLPFEEACLRFHENKRVVLSASSEQVRRPLNRQGIDQWQAFDPWLGPLKSALGSVLDGYPEVPAKG